MHVFIQAFVAFFFPGWHCCVGKVDLFSSISQHWKYKSLCLNTERKLRGLFFFWTSKQVLKQKKSPLCFHLSGDWVWNALTSFSFNFLTKYREESLPFDQDPAAGGSRIPVVSLGPCAGLVWNLWGFCRVVLKCLCPFPAGTPDKQLPVFSARICLTWNCYDLGFGYYLVLLYGFSLLQGHSSAGIFWNLLGCKGEKTCMEMSTINGR